MKKIISALMCVAVLLQLCACMPDNKNQASQTFTAMNTVMQITVFRTSTGTPQEVLELMTERVEELDKLFDANSTDSDTSHINSSTTQAIVSEETAELLQNAKQASVDTQGDFDITVMPVLKLWGFNDGNYGVPSANNIEAVLPDVDYKKVYVEGNTVKKSENTQISLGGIAKGFLGDELLKIAEEYGATALLSLGGNIVLCGEKSENEKWSVGIKNPRDTETVALSFECAGNKSVVTSGGYERYFEYGGKSYHHIIDPETGYPAESDLLSVTVMGEKGTMCDAYSTALYVMGKEKAVTFAKKHNDFDFIFITEDNEIYITDGVSAPKLDDEYTVKSIER